MSYKEILSVHRLLYDEDQSVKLKSGKSGNWEAENSEKNIKLILRSHMEIEKSMFSGRY